MKDVPHKKAEKKCSFCKKPKHKKGVNINIKVFIKLKFSSIVFILKNTMQIYNYFFLKQKNNFLKKLKNF